MDNAADALKIGFGILVFVVALSILFMLTSKTTATADEIFFYADETNYRDYSQSVDRDANRKVSVSEVITTLYRYYQERISVTVVFRDNAKLHYVFDLGHETDKDGNPVSLTDISQIENNLKEFIDGVLLAGHSTSTFTETFVEVPTTGMYSIAGGEELTLIAGSRKIYITYTEDE